jgi:hypothetical protein
MILALLLLAQLTPGPDGKPYRLYPEGAIAPRPPPDPPEVSKLRQNARAQRAVKSADICWRRQLVREAQGNDQYVRAMEQGIADLERQIAELHKKPLRCTSKKVKQLLRCKRMKEHGEPLPARCERPLARLFLRPQ